MSFPYLHIPEEVAYRVLLIEDDSKKLELYSDLIRSIIDCKIDVLNQDGNLVEWIARSNYQLIVVNEDEHGSTFLEQIKRISPTTSVIVLARNATVEKAVSAIRLGAEDYLSEPLSVESFQLAVKRGLDRKAVFSENTEASNFLHLLNSCQLISSSLEQGKIFEIIQSYFFRELKVGYSAIYTMHEGNPMRIDHLSLDDQQDRALEEILDITLRASNPLAPFSESSSSYRFIDRGQLTPGIFLFKFQCASPSEFFCAALSPERPINRDAFEGRLQILKSQIEVTGKNIERYLGVQKLVYLDDATGLYNTRYLNYVLDHEIQQQKESGKSFAVLFIDADRFKQVNDTHGHLIGTKLLNELGGLLKDYVRETDTVFRYGGDEFVAVLSPCDLETARYVAERMRESIEKRAFLKNENLNIKFTISIGVALFPQHAKSKKEIIEAADQAMYDAKKTSRNSVAITQSNPNSPGLKVAKVEKIKRKGTASGGR